MKHQDDQLNRLFKAAAAANPTPGAAVFALEARVMGDWRGMARTDSGEFLVAWFRRAAICGVVLAMATVLWNHERPNRSGAEVAIADSAMGMGVEP
jgi:hypothetical protein